MFSKVESKFRSILVPSGGHQAFDIATLIPLHPFCFLYLGWKGKFTMFSGSARTFVFLFAFQFASGYALAHDTWVQTAQLGNRTGDVVHVDLMLGNHGNGHRDFKLASKITLAPCSLDVILPDGTRTDLKPKATDMGYAEKEGFWSARMLADQDGVYQIIHSLDVLHGKVRAVKSSKSFFVATGNAPTCEPSPINLTRLNQGLEFELLTPIESISAGREIQLQALWNGKPMPDLTISFIPRGAVLEEGFDPRFERKSDSEGKASYTPEEGNFVLAVAHYVANDESGEDYERTHYGATLVLPVPQIPLTR